MSDRAAVTIVTRNYLHYARALVAAWRRVHPDVPIFVCLVDPLPKENAGAEDLGGCFSAAESLVPEWKRFSFQYSAAELSWALKPHAIRHVFGQGFRRVIYLDSDILTYRPLETLFEQLQTSNLVVTPHLLSPLPRDGKRPAESFFLLSGVCNAGFLGVRQGAVAEAFLDWWAGHLADSCITDLAGGLSGDQRWLDLALGLFEGIHLERRPGFNVGHWTFSQSRFSLAEDGQVLVDGWPLVFFHFSGILPDKPLDITCFQNRVSFDALPGVAGLLTTYSRTLDACGRRQCEAWGYGYATLTDRTPISPLWREAIRLRHPLLADVSDPFDPVRTPDLIRRFRRAERDVWDSRVDWKLRRLWKRRNLVSKATEISKQWWERIRVDGARTWRRVTAPHWTFKAFSGHEVEGPGPHDFHRDDQRGD